MKKIAVITGASSGMGKRFAETVNQYGAFDEVWVIARQQDKLEALRATVPSMPARRRISTINRVTSDSNLSVFRSSGT